MDANGATYHHGQPFYYPFPTIVGENINRRVAWSDWVEAPNQPEIADGANCGAGGLHIYKDFRCSYRKPNQYWRLARYLPEDILGEDEEKVRVRKMQTTLITPSWLHRLIRWGFFRYARLQGVNLHGANLQGANLQRADLEGANLKGANLKGANLQEAYLQRATYKGQT